MRQHVNFWMVWGLWAVVVMAGVVVESLAQGFSWLQVQLAERAVRLEYELKHL